MASGICTNKPDCVAYSSKVYKGRTDDHAPSGDGIEDDSVPPGGRIMPTVNFGNGMCKARHKWIVAAILWTMLVAGIAAVATFFSVKPATDSSSENNETGNFKCVFEIDCTQIKHNQKSTL